MHFEPVLHTVHMVRACSDPPCVYEPAPHDLHSESPLVSAYKVGLPHSVHAPRDGVEYVPASQAESMLEPSQVYPGLQTVQVVWVVREDPPLVKDPVGHVLHALAPMAL